MAIVRKRLPSGERGSSFVKYDPRVFLIKGLSDGSKVLYGYMASMRNGGEFSDVFFMRGLEISEKTYRRRKKELVEAGLIYVDRVGLKNYILYIGFMSLSALKVREQWLSREIMERESISVEELVESQGDKPQPRPIKVTQEELDFDPFESDEHIADLTDY